MIFLSFNCRGLANPDKRLALKELIAHKPIDIIFLQETLGDGDLLSKKRWKLTTSSIALLVAETLWALLLSL